MFESTWDLTAALHPLVATSSRNTCDPDDE
jgi:hypothetical protein